MFDVNFWGAMNVSKEALRVFREVNKPAGGRLLQVSSMAGLVGGPALTIYHASKFALEGLSESIAAEIDPEWNIKVTLIELGVYNTGGIDRIVVMPSHPAYTQPGSAITAFRGLLDNRDGLRNTGDPAKAAAAMYKLTTLPNPPLHLPLGKDSVAAARSKVAQLAAETDQYESWSDGLKVGE
ncbi:uncharacterized protein FIBRA_08461 [Fibroporia radiculosa]|uniref:NAD(P)-binding protein n=1 Tax=Fibroporia radiculosa TaxID=599839 RepID=J4ICD4_9APHY|nr:uncharacterized protein FIBRA_08461 [Fibroporia radiculosa]CCM06216.1 predicted protein [Fibroporia radiculosa]